MPGLESYFETVAQLLETVRREEAATIREVAARIVNSLSQGGVLHIFGAGHSHLLAEEISYRAGGLIAVNPILDMGYMLPFNSPSRATALERLEGYARSLMEDYDFRAGEVLIVCSQSGINPAPLEVALYGKEKGMTVVALTSLAHSRDLQSRHSSGKRLFEVADLVIDTHTPKGDAVLDCGPGLPRVAAVSTVIGASVLQALVSEVASIWMQTQTTPVPVWVSANLAAGDQHNQMHMSRLPRRRKW